MFLNVTSSTIQLSLEIDSSTCEVCYSTIQFVCEIDSSIHGVCFLLYNSCAGTAAAYVKYAQVTEAA